MNFKSHLSKFKNIIIKTLSWFIFFKKNFHKSIPIYLKNNTNGLKVHLGCGNINLQGWINVDARELFIEHGGESFEYIPCLNDNEFSINFLNNIIKQNLLGWLDQN